VKVGRAQGISKNFFTAEVALISIVELMNGIQEKEVIHRL